jgi:hypothetical protein
MRPRWAAVLIPPAQNPAIPHPADLYHRMSCDDSEHHVSQGLRVLLFRSNWRESDHHPSSFEVEKRDACPVWCPAVSRDQDALYRAVVGHFSKDETLDYSQGLANRWPQTI